ncbi:unnamed protein product [Pieris brassicae]|uniref:Uncharacterized protein n=1 Tax=Pieris brassicae TaxID=7116 RepID=A0A9P0TYC1_PIEBR|nr:unnamed protein product [Pieris brassicae]
MTYSQTLRLPSDIFNKEEITTGDDFTYVQKLRGILNGFRPDHKSHSNSSFFVHSDLKDSEYVFVRNEVHKPLKPTDDGPYRVLSRKSKVYKVEFPNRNVQISIDRLKPAYFLSNSSATVKHDDEHDTDLRTTPTRSGRVTRRPVRFANVKF